MHCELYPSITLKKSHINHHPNHHNPPIMQLPISSNITIIPRNKHKGRTDIEAVHWRHRRKGVHTSEVAAAESNPPSAAGVTRKKPSRLSPLVVLSLFPDSTPLLLLLCPSCCKCGVCCSCCFCSPWLRSFVRGWCPMWAPNMPKPPRAAHHTVGEVKLPSP